jgi:nucleoside-diphosphate-sugar epimerase
MPTTLVTGATGFVGSSVVDELLRQSHALVLAVRSPSSAKALIENNTSWPASALTIFPVPDFTAPGAFDSVFQEHPEIEYIVHVAAPMLDNPAHTDFVEHFEKPSVLGNLGLLKSAKEYGKNVKAISVTGSMNAITTGSQEDVKSRVFGNNEWLPLGRDDAIQANHNYVRSFPVLRFFYSSVYPTQRRMAMILRRDTNDSCRHLTDLLLCREKARRRSNLEIHQGGETFLHSHKFHAPLDLGSDAAAGKGCWEDQFQQLADWGDHG